MQKCVMLCACVEAGSKGLTRGERNTGGNEGTGTRWQLYLCCNLLFCSQRILHEQECGPHRHKIAASGE